MGTIQQLWIENATKFVVVDTIAYMLEQSHKQNTRFCNRTTNFLLSFFYMTKSIAGILNIEQKALEIIVIFFFESIGNICI